MTPRLKTQYLDEVAPHLMQEFSLPNKMAVPKLDKIVISVGLGKSLEGTKLNPKAREQAIKTLTQISGQKPVMIKAKRSVANFKLRAGYEVACMVTLRGDRMWEFFDRLVNLAIPRIKDFRGLKTTQLRPRGQLHLRHHRTGHLPRGRHGQRHLLPRDAHHPQRHPLQPRTDPSHARTVRLPLPQATGAGTAESGGVTVGMMNDE